MTPVFRSTKLWLGLGVFTLLQGSAAPDVAAQPSATPAPSAAAQGGEGGEGGISAETAATDPAAFIAAGFCAAAYWMVHGMQNFYPILNGGELAALYCFVFLYFVAAGPGAFSIDGARERKVTAA